MRRFAKSHLRIGFCIGTLWAVCHLGVAQITNLKLERLSTEKGLTQNLVYSIAQDDQGFLWFASDEGLNRFDGYEFKTFRHIPGDTNSLADNSVRCLFFDHQGLLWIGTNNGISQYNTATERILSLPVDYYDETKLNGNSVSAIKKDERGRIWIPYLGSGVDVIIPGEKNILHYTVHREKADPKRLPDDYVTCLEFLNNQQVVLGTRTGLYFVNVDGNVMTEAETLLKYPWRNKIDPSITCLLLSRDKKILWIGTEANGVYRVDLAAGTLMNFNTSNGSLLFNNNTPSLFEDSKGNTWIGGEAIYLFDDKKRELIPFNEFGIRKNVTVRNPIMTVFEDRDRNVWFGTFRMGVLKYNPRGGNILHYHAQQGEGSIGNNQVLSFNEDANRNLLVGTDGGGLYIYDKEKVIFKEAPLSHQFSSQVIKCLYRDQDGSQWIGTWDGGLMHYDIGKNKVEIFNPEHKNFGSRHVWEILPDHLGNLWIASLRDGLFYFDRRSKKFTNFKSDPNDSSSLVNNDVLSIFVDSRNALWAGTSDGLSVLKPGATKFINKQKNDGIAQVLSFYEDDHGRIWLGTNGGSILIVDSDVKVIKKISDQQGLPSTTICAMVADREKNLWVSTYNGLVKLNTENFSIEVIPDEAGLQGKEYIPRASFKTSEGKILFGGVNGFNILNPDSLSISPSISKIVFTTLKINNDEILADRNYSGRKILTQSISQTKEIALEHNDNSLTLTFSPLIYDLQSQIHYAYKLENFDGNWQFTDARKRFLHYTNLDPGRYQLQIKASFDGKNWSDPPQVLSIIISPSWWATIPFRVLSVFLGIAFLYGVYKARVKILKGQKKRLETLVQQRTVELKKSNEEIQHLLDELAIKKDLIEEQNHELLQVNDAVVHQRDMLEVKSTELERAQSKLKEANLNLEQLITERTQKLSDTLQELETFLYRASHDLRGPITSMLGIINLVSLDKTKDDLPHNYSQLLRKSVQQLDVTLGKLLLKHTIDKKPVTPEFFDTVKLETFIKGIRSEIPSFRADDFKATVRENVHLHVDSLMLKTVLIGLLENAFFFSAKSAKKEVSLVVSPNGKHNVFEITDHGAGIKPELKDKIFQMFYRGHESSTGNGLGLYMVKGALQKIKGNIEVESEEGSYSVFKVFIPMS